MGKSRSATVICAYLMQKYGLSSGEALSQLREARPFAEPNDGFMRQLKLYHEIGVDQELQKSATYQKWLFEREVEMSRV